MADDLGEPAARQIVRRSSLIVPVSVPAFVEKAHLRGADAVNLDLEDSIPLGEKDRARALVAAAIPAVGRGGADVTVRINRPWALAHEDLDAAIWPGLSGISYPKPETAEEIQRLDEAIGRLEPARGIEAGTVKIGITIETVAGFFNARELVRASSRLVDLNLGTDDFTLDLGVEPTAEGMEVLYPKLFVVLLARHAGLYPLGMLRSLADFRDLEGYRLAVDRAAGVGYRGANCIHPNQVSILNEGFAPGPGRVEYARRVIEVYSEAEAGGRSSAALDGKMIDLPVVTRARRLIERAHRIAAVERRKREALAMIGEVPLK
jgi:citrate lyase subunit beta / citryl-CoA lyase